MQRRALIASALLVLPLTVLAAAKLRPAPTAAAPATVAATGGSMSALPDLGPMPELAGGTKWINSPPLTRDSLRGRVTMVEVWTYGCYNCLNALPHIKATAARYKDAGLVTIGVHTPEFDRERIAANVERRVQALGVVFPVVMDNDFAIWRSFNNRYWPAVYIVDKKGRIRFHHDGEGKYDEIDGAVKTLLDE